MANAQEGIEIKNIKRQTGSKDFLKTVFQGHFYTGPIFKIVKKIKIYLGYTIIAKKIIVISI